MKLELSFQYLMFVVVSVSFFLWGNTFLYFFSFVNKTRALKIDFNIQRFAELESEISYALGSSWGTNIWSRRIFKEQNYSSKWGLFCFTFWKEISFYSKISWLLFSLSDLLSSELIIRLFISCIMSIISK